MPNFHSNVLYLLFISLTFVTFYDYWHLNYTVELMVTVKDQGTSICILLLHTDSILHYKHHVTD